MAVPVDVSPVCRSAEDFVEARPRRAPGLELLGKFEGSGYERPRYLVRRSDGQMAQLTELLYRVAMLADGENTSRRVATCIRAETGVDVEPADVVTLVADQLEPIGIVSFEDTAPAVASSSLDQVLALRVRGRVLTPRFVNAVASRLRVLFTPVVVLLACASFVALDVWAVKSGRLHGVTDELVARPSLMLVVIGLVMAGLVFHEFGHASACSYGGGRPGAIGVGLYVIWPVLYTDVSDTYRLTRRARVRTDLGGVYFNVLFGVALGALYLAVDYLPVLLAALAMNILIANQLLPFMRFDGYWVISDLTGVPDLFPRLGAALRRVVRPRGRSIGLDDLKPYARRVVVVWAVITTVALAVQAAWVFVFGPAIVRTIAPTIRADARAMVDAASARHFADAGVALVNVVLLSTAALGLVYMAYICLRGALVFLRRKLQSPAAARLMFVAILAVFAALAIWSSTVFGRRTIGGVTATAPVTHTSTVGAGADVTGGTPQAATGATPAAPASPLGETTGGTVSPAFEGLTILESTRNLDGSVTIRGVVPSGARLTVNGSPVAVAPDGSFIVTMPSAADSRTVVVEAVSADGTMTARSTVSVTGQGQGGSSVQQSSIVVRR
jgi:putative peptide zinc metalloprotease protein